MSRILISLFLSAFMLCAAMPAHSYTYQFNGSSVQLKWPTATITVALSPTLSSANVAGGDAVGAARRALARWSAATNIQFVETSSSATTIARDNVNLITFAPISAVRPGITQITSDTATGAIIEADVAINSGEAFSTNVTPNTYDLESTLVHEIGHLLGLNHSGDISASMNPRQARNFIIPVTNSSFPATTMRTLAADDLAGIRALYGQRVSNPVGEIRGTVNYGAGAHVWAENLFTGRIVGSSITDANGNYSIQQVPPGSYRVIVEYLNEPVVAAEISSGQGPYAGIGTGNPFVGTERETTVAAGTPSFVNLAVTSGTPTLNPRVFGINGMVQGAPASLVAGTNYRVLIGGEGLNLAQLPASAYSVTTPFMSIDAASFRQENFNTSFPIVSFNLTVADSAKTGNYSIRIRRADTGETAYISGGLSIDPYTSNVELNPLDNNNFFVRQQYLDFLFREPEPSGAAAWLSVLNRCDANFSPDCDRITVSSAFFRSVEFQIKGFFIYRFYRLALNRQPTYVEIIPDLQFVTGQTEAEVYAKRAAYANSFVMRNEFRTEYDNRPPAAYVDALLARYGLTRINTIDPANPDTGAAVILTRDDLVNRLNANTFTRAQILRAIVESQEVASREFNPGFVAMQYFGYLKRDAEPAGFNGWLNYLTANPGDFRTMVNGFANSLEYRSRFGH